MGRRSMERSEARAAAKTRDVRIALLFAALAMALALARPIAGGGVGLDYDAVNYVSVADSLVAGDGFRQVFENDFSIARYTRTEAREPYVRWAPLWPVLLAATSAAPFLTTQTAALPLNVFAFGALAFACSLWLLRNLSSRRLALWFALAVALSPPLARMAAWALTETLFSLFLVLALMALEARLRDSGGRRVLWLGVACAALACLLRYSGLTITAFGVAALLLLPRQGALRDVRARSVDAAAWLLSAVPVGFWMVRNVAIGHGPTGVREAARASLPESLAEHLQDLGGWLIVQQPLFLVADGKTGMVQTAAVCGAIALFAWLTWKRRPSWVAAECRDYVLLAFGGFAILYFLFLVLWSHVSFLHPLGGRHIVPLYAPIVLALSVITDRSGVFRFYPVAIWLVMLHAGDMLLTVGAMERTDQSGDLARYLRNNTATAVMISNNPAATYLLTDGKVSSYPYLSALTSEAVSAINTEETWVVWTHSDWYGFTARMHGDFSLEDLRRNPVLEVLVELPDGAVFRIRLPGSHPRRQAKQHPFNGAISPVLRIPESGRVRYLQAWIERRASR